MDIIITHILQMRKLRHGEVGKLELKSQSLEVAELGLNPGRTEK